MNRPVKWRRILAELANGVTLDKFQAERIGDHSLATTISRIQREGVIVSRRLHEVTGYASCPAWVSQYWLDPIEREKALRILGTDGGRCD